MIRFRSWSEVSYDYVYFEDGRYYMEQEICFHGENFFDWKTAQQQHVRNGVEMYDGDKLRLSENSYGIVAVRNGILGCYVYDTLDNYFGFRPITDYRKLEVTDDKI